MSISNKYPPNRPQIIYNVINGPPDLPITSTFARNSISTTVGPSGLISTVGANEPKFTYDPTTLEYQGINLERETYNNIIGSNDFLDSVKWYKSPKIDVVANAAISPDGTNNAYSMKQNAAAVSGGSRLANNGLIASDNTQFVFSVFVKLDTTDSSADTAYNMMALRSSTTATSPTSGSPSTYWTYKWVWNQDGTFNSIYSASYDFPVTIQEYQNGWYRIWAPFYTNSASIPQSNFSIGIGNEIGLDPTLYSRFFIYGAQIEEVPTGIYVPSSYIPTTTAAVTREEDELSLNTIQNFNSGFSLLLDSETTTNDFIYQIYDSSDVKKIELENDNGTLKWDIDGTSAQSEGTYPQVGFTKGRVRTISSLGDADGLSQTNYLYTTGLSFPTDAVVPPNLNKITFGVPQTLKALYIWNGQLDPVYAVSLIKGILNVVPDIPIAANSYSFVYNTDPTDTGVFDISLPYIEPKTTMTIDWGDGNSDQWSKGAVPTHTYPYPGQYRIQIEAATGFDNTVLGLSPTPQDSIIKVDQWSPEYRTTASGDGYTGDDLAYMLGYQTTCTDVPPFKYTDLTTLTNFALYTWAVQPNNWNWIPYNLPECTELNGAFASISIGVPIADAPERSHFPQLKTSNKLTSVSGCFANIVNEGWRDMDTLATTNKPFTVSSAVTNFNNCFNNYQGTSIDVDMSAGTTFQYTFTACNQWTSFAPGVANPDAMVNAELLDHCWEANSALTSFPAMNFPNATGFSYAWRDCSSLTSFPLIDTSSGVNFGYAWFGCSDLASFPAIDTSEATSLTFAWYGCDSLDNITSISAATSFPVIDVGKVKDASYAWFGCTAMTTFPLLQFPEATNMSFAWQGCTGLTSFPLITIPKATSLYQTWNSCNSLTAFSSIDVSSVKSFYSCWYACTAWTAFPKLDFSSAEDLRRAWWTNTGLTTFPAGCFDTTGTLRDDAFALTFTNCALTATSIENILVSLDTNGQSNIELGIDGGTNAAQSTWTTAANTAYTNLINKGWTIAFNP